MCVLGYGQPADGQSNPGQTAPDKLRTDKSPLCQKAAGQSAKKFSVVHVHVHETFTGLFCGPLKI